MNGSWFFHTFGHVELAPFGQETFGERRRTAATALFRAEDRDQSLGGVVEVVVDEHVIEKPIVGDLGARPVETIEELVAHLRGGEKPPERWRVGTEHEKIGLYADTHAPVPYGGERGIAAVLRGVSEADDWKPLLKWLRKSGS